MMTPGGKQNLIIINESGLYSLILSSKLPNAKKFKRWVTSEVLPAIRKTGFYVQKSNEQYIPQLLMSIYNGGQEGVIASRELTKIEIEKALGYTNPSKATNDHCKKAKMLWGNDLLGRRQEFKVIPEGDMYRLVTHSKLESAERFESWVFDDVLPSIRKTGGYIPVKEEDSDVP